MTCTTTKSQKGMGIYVAARIQELSPPFDVLTEADVDEITWHSVDKAAPTTIVEDGTLDPADVMFDTLQTTDDNPDWKFSDGYNFGAEIPGSAFPLGNKTYVLVITVTPAVGDPIIIQQEHQTAVYYPN